jgi:phenylalanyl-tRNA synthetase alpha chain
MDDIKKAIADHETNFLRDLAIVKTEDELEALRIKYLSRHGILSNLMHQLKDMTLEDRRIYGPALNELKDKAQSLFTQRQQELEEYRLKQQEYSQTHFDVTAYKRDPRGSVHPYTAMIEQAEDIFVTMGYEIVDGPEVETEHHNFEALNIPKYHPARDMQDTFWLTLPGMLMRTHTSTVEVHTMLKRKPPIAIVAPGRAYRNEATDASHDFMFMQLEGLFVDKHVSLAHLFATVKSFLQALFEKRTLRIRIRPSYFPFVEPGVEIDMTCPFCPEGCPICKKTGWIEICGAGLTHPHVLQACGINPEHYGGFAFGFGLTRLVMLKYGITDIRLLHSNRIDFLKQF